MDKSILIHHDKIPGNLLDCFTDENKKAFNYSGNDEFSNLDEYISKEIIQNYLINKKPSIIYIKDNLSANYLELYGLRVAYHIRLSQELADTRYVPIVILSDLNGYTLNKLEPMARILFTKNIFLEPNTQSTIKTFNEKYISKLTEKEFSNKFLKVIEIEPPENSSSHSIANEWAIYKWAKELNINDSVTVENTVENVSHQLYFKYLQGENKINEGIENKKSKIKKLPSTELIYSFKNKTNILCIDDEWDKGWKDIFDTYFKSYPSDNDLEILSINFNNKKFEDIEKKIVDKIFKYKPDLIVLDMRLVQDDHNELISSENISGIQLLNKIKNTSVDTKLNPGVQIIMLSATGRSDILEQANKDNKILGYIKKDHMEDETTKTNENILKLKGFLEDAEKKFYLKEIWKIQNDILKKINDQESLDVIRIEIGSVFSVLNSNVENPYDFTVFTFTKCLEAISLFYINEYTMKYLDDPSDSVGIYDHNDNAVYDYENEKWYKGTENRLHNILYEKLGLVDRNYHRKLCELINCRNNLAHPNGRKPNGCNLIEEVDHVYILKWFILLKTIIFKISEEKSLK